MDIESWQSQLRKGATELVVLASLRTERAYGLGILEAVNAKGPLLSEGGLYPLLARLEKSGRVAAKWELPDAGGNPRKYYQLTDAGRALLGDMRARWGEFRTTVDALLEDDG